MTPFRIRAGRVRRHSHENSFCAQSNISYDMSSREFHNASVHTMRITSLSRRFKRLWWPGANLLTLGFARGAAFAYDTLPKGLGAAAHRMAADKPQSFNFSDECSGVAIYPARPLLLKASEGSLWVTFRGDAEDYMLLPGDCLLAAPGSRPIVQGLAGRRLLVAPLMLANGRPLVLAPVTMKPA